MRVRAVLFDMDGVLLDSYQAWLELLRAALAHFAGGSLTEAEFERTWGQGVADDCRQYLPQVSPAALAAFYLEHFDEHAVGVRLLPGALSAVDACRDDGRRVACVTNTPATLARRTLAATGLLERFDAIVGDGDAARPKPAPDGLLLALERLGFAPEEALMVGDSSYDVEAAAAAGVASLVVGDGAVGDLRVASLEELSQRLRERDRRRAGGTV